MTATPRELAEFYRLALGCGFCDRAEVRRWADDLIAGGGAAAERWQLDLALAGDQADLDALLRRVPGSLLGSVPALLLLGRMHRRYLEGVVAPVVLAARLYVLFHEGVLAPELGPEIYRLEAAIIPDRRPVAEAAKGERLLADFLARFAPFADDLPATGGA